MLLEPGRVTCPMALEAGLRFNACMVISCSADEPIHCAPGSHARTVPAARPHRYQTEVCANGSTPVARHRARGAGVKRFPGWVRATFPPSLPTFVGKQGT